MAFSKQDEQVLYKVLKSLEPEIKTLLHSTLGSYDLLRQTTLRDDQAKYLSLAEQSTERMRQMFIDLIDYSSPDKSFDSDEFDLFSLIEDVLSEVSDMAFRRKIELLYSYSEEMSARFVGSGSIIKRILLNIFSDIIDYSDQKELLFSIEETETENKHSVVFIIPFNFTTEPVTVPTILEPIWERKELSPQYGGMGLYISKRLAERIGGSTKWKKDADGNWQLHIAIPVDVCEDSMRDYRIHAEKNLFCDKKILLISEHKSIGLLLVKSMVSHCLHPVNVDSIEKAKERLEEEDFFAVFFVVPNSNELGVVKTFFESLISKKLPVLISAPHEKYKGLDSIQLNGTATLYRPLKYKRIFDLLKKIGLSGIHDSDGDVTPDEDAKSLADIYPLKILIAEDNTTNRTLILSYVTKLGYEPTIAVNGRHALKQAKRSTFDLILMDLFMPEMDGFEASATIKQNNDDYGEPIIVAISVLDSELELNRLNDSQVDDFIEKPVHFNDLQKLILKWAKVLKGETDDQANGDESEEPINPETLERLKELADMQESEFLADLLHAFINQTEALLGLLSDEIKGNDFDKVKRHVHTLKGSSLNLGAIEMSELSRQLEKKAGEKDPNGMTELLKAIRVSYEKSISKLANILDLEL